LLPDGYWRSSENSDKIYKCYNNPDNCQGDLNKAITANINYCKKGYAGVLCEDCDYSGKIWGI
jgi:hypothetical protein